MCQVSVIHTYWEEFIVKFWQLSIGNGIRKATREKKSGMWMNSLVTIDCQLQYYCQGVSEVLCWAA